MITNKSGAELHDRMTRGETLTDDERILLAQWYAEQDEAEQQLLAQAYRNTERVDVNTLQAQLTDTLTQIELSTRRIQQLTRENDDLRREIASLRL